MNDYVIEHVLCTIYDRIILERLMYDEEKKMWEEIKGNNPSPGSDRKSMFNEN